MLYIDYMEMKLHTRVKTVLLATQPVKAMIYGLADHVWNGNKIR